MEKETGKVLVSQYGHTFTPIKKTAVYGRISTYKKSQINSVNSQISMLIEKVEHTYDLRLAGVYVDIGSGKNADSRKELKRLIADCEAGEIEAVVTKSVSRFGRNTVDTLSICRKLKKAGVNVHFYNECIDSIDRNGELTLTLVSALAQAESFEKSKNVKWGIEKTAYNPDASIYSRICYGYMKDNDGNLSIIDNEAAVVKMVYDKYLEGYSIQKIIQLLYDEKVASPTGKEKWSKRTVEKMLVNEKYYGDVILYKTYTADYPSTEVIVNHGEKEKMHMENHHEGIISKELFDQVQLEIEKRKRK